MFCLTVACTPPDEEVVPSPPPPPDDLHTTLTAAVSVAEWLDGRLGSPRPRIQTLLEQALVIKAVIS
jgi:hypothetical protein